MKAIANTFLQGLLFSLPIIFTFGLIFWLLRAAENLSKGILRLALPEEWYFMGMGVIVTLTFFFVIGLLVRAYFIGYLFKLLDALLRKIPLVRAIYTNAKDLMMFFGGDQAQAMAQVVSVEVTEGIQLIGFVTNCDVSLGGQDDLIAVYFPMSYQVGGYLAYMPKSRCRALNMPVQTAMQQVLTAHIKRPDASRNPVNSPDVKSQIP